MVDKKVVIPDDMGAGLKFENDKWNVNAGKGLTINQTTNQIEIKTGGGAGGTGTGPSTGVGVNSDGKLTVLRSPDAGNLLELRDNGLYYGIQAPQIDYYVSYSGNDNNPGTRAAPKRTINGALNAMVNGNYEYKIYLKENEEHHRVNGIVGGHLTAIRKLTVATYGDKIDNEIYPANWFQKDIHYKPWKAKIYPRAGIDLGYHLVENGPNPFIQRDIFLPDAPQCSIIFEGVYINFLGYTGSNNTPSIQHALPAFIGTTQREGQAAIVFDGCIFRFSPHNLAAGNSYNSDSIFRVRLLCFDNSAIVNPNNNNHGAYGYDLHFPTISFRDNDTGTTGINGIPPLEIYETLRDFAPTVRGAGQEINSICNKAGYYITNISV